jgi:hypothetical protein
MLLARSKRHPTSELRKVIVSKEVRKISELDVVAKPASML